jgi:(1->4)-alpha-D-glucan 1-alpha-D-glucosylmutase
VPDVYQGCELWDLSLVDPDNRRPVDYALRHRYLQQIKAQETESITQLQSQLLQQPEDSRVKLYLLYKALHTRRALQNLFDFGDYIPLKITGALQQHVLAFARHYQQQWCLVVVPLLLAQLIKEGVLPLGQEVWQDTAVILPEGAPSEWQQVFGQETVTGSGSLQVATIFKNFPVALLTASAV